MKKCQIIDLSYNQLSFIPSTISELHELKTLGLSVNLLEELPTHCFSELFSLKHLQLHNNKLKSLPEDLKTLHNLELLDISDNQFESNIPECIRYMKNLISLNISNNNLYKINRQDLEKCSQLQSLNLSFNRIEKIQELFGTTNQDDDGLLGIWYVNLKIFKLNNNQLKNIEDFPAFQQLEEVYLHDNQLQHIPSNLQKVARLTVHNNMLDCVPEQYRDKYVGHAWQGNPINVVDIDIGQATGGISRRPSFFVKSP